MLQLLIHSPPKSKLFHAERVSSIAPPIEVLEVGYPPLKFVEFVGILQGYFTLLAVLLFHQMHGET